MFTIFRTLLLACIVLLATSCSKQNSQLPEQATPLKEVADIYPDYRDIVAPPNIAPLDFMVKNEADEAMAHLVGGGKELIAEADENGTFRLDSLAWRDLLTAARGAQVEVTLYVKRKGDWHTLTPFHITVAQETIDRYLSYRLIEPSYELYRQLGLYQRDLEGFGVTTIYENNREYSKDDNHCINCHNYQNYSTERMLFHVRAKHGGTVLVENGKPRKLNMKSDSILSSTVYPTWHPDRNWVVFSSNQTGQVFHMKDPQKIEVVDYGSDLVFYDADRNELRNILKTEADLETFPCWAPDGRRVFYCSAHVPEFVGKTAEQRQDIIGNIHNKVRYNLMSLPFDPATGKFGAPVVEMDCAAEGKSCAVPRISPDGRYCLFTLADFGQFHIWHTSSDLYVKDLVTGAITALAETNSPNVDSYHTWSSNGRWIVFSSRRDDGSYTRPYIAYFDKDGRGHKAFLLPQEDPEQNLRLTKSYNVPELTRDAVRTTAKQLKECIYRDEDTQKVKYVK